MSWFEEQIKYREQAENADFADAVDSIVNAVMGTRLRNALSKDDLAASAIDEILRFYHINVKEEEIPRQPKTIDEQIAFSDLYDDDDAVWSLLYASGYLKAVNISEDEYELAIVNYEVLKYFRKMIKKWFNNTEKNYNEFIKSLLNDDTETMEECLENLAVSMMSFFDGGKNESEKLSPEKFYHGFVLGLMVDLKDRYLIESNRESGLGRADIIMIPKDTKKDNGIIIEFKVRSQRREQNLDETVQSALDQIERNMYSQKLTDAGVPEERIRKYGFAFEGKTVKIGK